MKRTDFLIIGAGIIGLTIARELTRRFPGRKIIIIEKEADVAFHASGRNSGVLHAGFYYTENSLKARFTKDGNRMMREYCRKNGIPINPCGKLVVATNEEDLKGLDELKRRGDRNGVELVWFDEQDVAAIDPQARTFRKALYSPTTASVNPLEVCQAMKRDVERSGGEFRFSTRYIRHKENKVFTNTGEIDCEYVINAAGLYADQIARKFGFGKDFTILPFKGIYLKYAKNKTDIRTHIYPVPILSNPFLGVHFTKTVDGSIKIGPTAIPAFWREQYRGLSRFRLGETLNILYHEMRLFWHNSFGFRQLAFTEMQKYARSHFIGLAQRLVKHVPADGFGDYIRPGIRAQLLNKRTLELVQDFIIEGDGRSLHVLNAVSPAFTCSIPFATYVVDRMIVKQGGIRFERD